MDESLKEIYSNIIEENIARNTPDSITERIKAVCAEVDIRSIRVGSHIGRRKAARNHSGQNLASSQRSCVQADCLPHGDINARQLTGHFCLAYTAERVLLDTKEILLYKRLGLVKKILKTDR